MSGVSSAITTNRMILSCSTLIVAALFVACDRPEPTAPLVSPAAESLQESRIPEIPEWVGNLLNGSVQLSADEAGTQEELPGMGHKFQLFFAMMDDQDPQNP